MKIHVLAVRTTALSSYSPVVLWLAITKNINFQINNDSFNVSDAAPTHFRGITFSNSHTIIMILCKPKPFEVQNGFSLMGEVSYT